MNTRIYEVRTEVSDTLPGHTYDRFTIAAQSFDEAVTKAKAKLKTFKPEKIREVVLLAMEGD